MYCMYVNVCIIDVTTCFVADSLKRAHFYCKLYKFLSKYTPLIIQPNLRILALLSQSFCAIFPNQALYLYRYFWK